MSAAAFPLPEVPFLRLRVTFTARRRGELPAYKGSLLRGAFGHALRRAVCAMGPKEACGRCPLREGCIYTSIFEPLAGRRPPPFLAGLPSSPRPFVFEPRGSRRRFGPGEALGFDLLLFGAAVKLQGYAVLALERMARAGLGARRLPFALERVRSQDAAGAWQVGYERGLRRWCGAVPAVRPRCAPLGGERVRLRFATPTRLKVDGRLVDRVAFPTLAFKMLRRTLELAHFFGPGERLDWSFEEQLERARRVRVVRSDLRWQDWQRYSNRQGTKMKLGGFVGEVELAGELEPFAPLLRTAEVVHVGKGATFGLGKVEVG